MSLGWTGEQFWRAIVIIITTHKPPVRNFSDGATIVKNWIYIGKECLIAISYQAEAFHEATKSLIREKMMTLNQRMLFVLVFLTVGLFGCGGGSSSSNEEIIVDKGGLSFHIRWGESTQPLLAPSGVSSLRIVVTGTGMSPWQEELDTSQSSAVIDGIPAGSNRAMIAQGIGADGELLYEGRLSGLTISAGQITTAGTLTLQVVFNLVPIAHAGTDQTVSTQSTVTLDGSSSRDGNDDPLTYLWEFISRPEGSIAFIVNSTTDSPSFVADREGNYVVQLTVNDGQVTSASDTVTVIALTTTPPSQPTFFRAVPRTDQINLSWSGVIGATGYTLSYATQPLAQATEVTINEVTGTNYTHNNPTVGVVYYYQLQAESADGTSVASRQLQASTAANMTMTITSPALGKLVDDPLQVVVDASSQYEIRSIHATLPGGEYPLTYDACAQSGRIGCQPGWVGSLPLQSLSRGGYALQLRALDANGGMIRGSTTIFYDQPPQLQITAPVNNHVELDTFLWIDAVCNDDDPSGCVSLTISVDNKLIMTTPGSFRGNITLPESDGRQLQLSLVARDSMGQTATVNRTLYSKTTGRLSLITRTSGRVLDFSQDGRALVLNQDENGAQLDIIDTRTDTTSTIFSDPERVPQYGYLTPYGAVFMAQSGSVLTSRLFDYTQGVLTDLASPNSAQSLVAGGDYVIWNEMPDLKRLNLVTRQIETLATNAGNWRNSINAQGTVAYWTFFLDYNIFTTDGINRTQLTTGNSFRSTYPLIDGDIVVYRRDSGLGSGTSLLMHHPTLGNVTLSPAGEYEHSPYRDYQVRNGWIAFTRPGTTLTPQVWRRAPDGTLTQITAFSTASTIVSLSDNGDILLSNSSKLYAYRTQMVDLDTTTLLKPFFLGTKSYVLLGNSVFEFDAGW